MQRLTQEQFLQVFEKSAQARVNRSDLRQGQSLMNALHEINRAVYC